MSEIKWIKLTTTMFDDEKIKLIEAMPDRDTILIIWIKLLAQAGKCNASGHLILSQNIAYSDEMLAAIFNRPLNTVRMALETFKTFGMIEIDDNAIHISNWEKHQNIEGMEKIRKQNRERFKKHYDKKKETKLLEKSNVRNNVETNISITQSNATDIDIELELDIEKDVDDLLGDRKGKNHHQQQNTFSSQVGQSGNAFTGRTVKSDMKGITSFYESEGFGTLSGSIAQQIILFLDDNVEEKTVILALQEAVNNNKRAWSYAKRCLENWINLGYKTEKQVNAYILEFQNKKKSKEEVKKDGGVMHGGECVDFNKLLSSNRQ